MDVSGFAGVKGAMAIIDLELRCRSKQEITQASNLPNVARATGTTRVRRMLAILPSAVASVKTRSVVSTGRWAKAISLALIRVEQRFGCAARE
jgi:hypothetical protein